MTTRSESSGAAALSICEALLLALADLDVLPERELLGVLEDAASSHENMVGTAQATEEHRNASHLIRAIIAARVPPLPT